MHNLEHGYIVALYQGEPDPATVQALRRFVEQAPATDPAAACGYRAKVLVARFDDMTTPFAVLAWDHLLQLSIWDAGRGADVRATLGRDKEASRAEASLDAEAPADAGIVTAAPRWRNRQTQPT